MSVKIVLNEPKILDKVQNDKFGLFMATAWYKILLPYTPKQDGFLNGTSANTVKLRPFQIEYCQRYSHYIYNGEIYVDPKTKISGFLTANGWRSRKGIKKVPSGRQFTFHTPGTFAHWDRVAIQAGQTDKLTRECNKYLKTM